MIASLGMYDRAETAEAHDRLWACIRDALRGHSAAAPDALTRGAGAYWDAWTAPDLTLSQTCGYPFRARLHQQVTLIGTPDYDLPGCPSGHYYSVYVARVDDPRATLADFDGADFAYNEPMSQSGWAAPQNHAAALGLHLRPVLESGGHRLSALAVAEGRADLAALDAVTWALLQRHEPFAQGLKAIGRTDPPTPALPYIAAKGVNADLYFAALQEAIAALSQSDRDTLLLRGVVRIAAEDYLAVPNPPSPDQIAHKI